MVFGAKEQGSKSLGYRTASERKLLQANPSAFALQSNAVKEACHGRVGDSKGDCWLHGIFASILEAVYCIGDKCELHVHLFRKVGIQESLILFDFQETGRIPM